MDTNQFTSSSSAPAQAQSSRGAFAQAQAQSSIAAFAQAQPRQQAAQKDIIHGSNGVLTRSQQILPSTYTSEKTKRILNCFSADAEAERLCILGVGYTDGDFQIPASEGTHVRETTKDCAARCLEEEFGFKPRGVELKPLDEEVLPNGKRNYHYGIHIRPGQYTTVPIESIRPNRSLDDGQCKATVYVYGTREALEPILRAYQRPTADHVRAGHDNINALVMMPFTRLREFLQQQATRIEEQATRKGAFGKR
jgi:ADP-ribose pyrophosphatase YjhB (NUDIX family)